MLGRIFSLLHNSSLTLLAYTNNAKSTKMYRFARNIIFFWGIAPDPQAGGDAPSPDPLLQRSGFWQSGSSRLRAWLVSRGLWPFHCSSTSSPLKQIGIDNSLLCLLIVTLSLPTCPLSGKASDKPAIFLSLPHRPLSRAAPISSNASIRLQIARLTSSHLA